ncbi:MAG TPA: RNA methyltransferase [Burkholderiaceae bacterium]|nr:RNA methyltransferase [Burkholderiaceae bacterium]
MSTPNITLITSRDNSLLKELRRLKHDSTGYRKQGQVWLEGDHLCKAAILRGISPTMAVFSESFMPLASEYIAYSAIKNIAIVDKLWAEISSLESPAKMGFVIDLPQPTSILPGVPTVILDRVQDAGNVGSILRSAAAFGFKQIIALKGTAALWSPKVLRAGMGAHFTLQLVENVTLEDLKILAIPLVVTSSHQGEFLQNLKLPSPCAWVMGNEGQGVTSTLLEQAQVKVRIGQPGGEESLNVAAAAAICLHASSVQLG